MILSGLYQLQIQQNNLLLAHAATDPRCCKTATRWADVRNNMAGTRIACWFTMFLDDISNVYLFIKSYSGLEKNETI